MSNELSHILTNPETALRESQDPLARLWRLILADLKTNPITFHDLLNRWLDDPANGVPPGDSAKRSYVRGNTIRELTRPHMTWRVFMKGLSILGPEFVEIGINLRWSATRITYHTIGMPLKYHMLEESIEVKIDGKSIETSIPPLSESRWHGVQTGMTVTPSPHTHVTYEFKEPKQEDAPSAVASDKSQEGEDA